MKTPEGEKTAEFAKLKYQVGEILVRKFLEYNDGKFHTGLEFNPPTHALTEFMQAYADQQLNNAIQKCIEVVINDQDILWNGSDVIGKLESLKIKQP